MHKTWISSFLMTFMTREPDGDKSPAFITIGSTGHVLGSTCIWFVDVMGVAPMIGSRSTTSFSTSFRTLKTIPPSWLSLAQDTWKALGHLPFVHCIGAPCALGRFFIQAEHFYTISVSGGITLITDVKRTKCHLSLTIPSTPNTTFSFSLHWPDSISSTQVSGTTLAQYS